MVKGKTAGTDFFGSPHPVSVGRFLLEHLGQASFSVLIEEAIVRDKGRFFIPRLTDPIVHFVVLVASECLC